MYGYILNWKVSHRLGSEVVSVSPLNFVQHVEIKKKVTHFVECILLDT